MVRRTGHAGIAHMSVLTQHILQLPSFLRCTAKDSCLYGRHMWLPIPKRTGPFHKQHFNIEATLNEQRPCMHCSAHWVFALFILTRLSSGMQSRVTHITLRAIQRGPCLTESFLHLSSIQVVVSHSYKQGPGIAVARFTLVIRGMHFCAEHGVSPCT